MTARTTEEKFLNARIGHPVAVFLISGLRLTGTLIDADDHAIFLRAHGSRLSVDQMIYKLAISTIESDASTDDWNSRGDLGGLLTTPGRHTRK